MLVFAACFDSFIIAVLKSELQNSVYRLVWGGGGLGPTLAAVSWYLESAKSELLANLVSSLHRDGKDLGHAY